MQGQRCKGTISSDLFIYAINFQLVRVVLIKKSDKFG